MRTLIISGGEFQKSFCEKFIKREKYDYIIAVDKGLEYALDMDISPDLIMGDLDSAKKESVEKCDKKSIRTFNSEKNDTDTELAVREAVTRGNPIDILCGTGGRIDHLLGNIHILSIALDYGIEARLIDKNNVIFLRNQNFVINKGEWPGKYISFIPFSGNVMDVKLKGFKYPLDGYDLKPGITRCISNEIVDDIATVEFTNGSLIVINSLDVESE